MLASPFPRSCDSSHESLAPTVLNTVTTLRFLSGGIKTKQVIPICKANKCSQGNLNGCHKHHHFHAGKGVILCGAVEPAT